MKRKARPLQAGDVVAIVAPSGAVHRESLSRGIKILESWGFRVKVGSSVFNRYGYLAGTDEERARDFMTAWEDPEVKGVIAARGGYGAMRILPYLDFDTIRKNPKVLLGFSDITALHLALWKETGLVTFHGPVAEIGEEGFLSYNERVLQDVLWGTWPPGYLPLPHENGGEATANDVQRDARDPDSREQGLRVLEPGEATGELVGGNLSLIASTIGTRWELDTRGKILFLEDVGEKPYRVDRMLCQLKLAGKLDDAAGFCLGDFTDCDPDPGRPSFQVEEVLAQYFEGCGKPCIAGLPAGHGELRATLPLGVLVRITTSPPSIEFLERALED